MATQTARLAMGAGAAAIVGVIVLLLLSDPETPEQAAAVSDTAAATSDAPAASEPAASRNVAAAPAENPEAAVPAEAEAAAPEANDAAEPDVAAAEADPAAPVAAAEPAAPVFTSLYLRPDGTLVVSGTAEPGQTVAVMVAGTMVAESVANAVGDFAAIGFLDPADQPRRVTLLADPAGLAIASAADRIIPADQVTVAAADPAPVIGEATADTPEAETATADVVPETPAEVPAPEAETTAMAAAPEAETATVDAIPAETPDPSETGTATAETAETAAPAEEAAPAATATQTVTSADGATSSGQTETEAAEAVAEAGEPAQTVSADPEAPAPAPILEADAEGVRVVSPAPQVQSTVALDTITYDDTGEVQLAGRAGGTGFVRVYIDNRPITTGRIAEGGQWRTELPDVDTGVYTLRIDEVDAAGAVVSRIETPFKREEAENVAAVMAEETAQEDFDIATKTVQPGMTLWAIARERFGDGIMYVAVYEANKDQIRNPDLIYPGQVFRLPTLEVSEDDN